MAKYSGGIEHRDTESLIAAYQYQGCPMFIILAGADVRTKYDGNDLDEGAEKLSNFCNIIENSGTSMVYTLKCFMQGTTNPFGKGTIPDFGTKFMLNSDTPTKIDPQTGVVVIDRAGKAQQYTEQRNAPINAAIIEMQAKYDERIAKMEAMLNNEREARHKAELESMRRDMDAKIGAIANLQPQPEDRWDKLIGLVSDIIKDPTPVHNWLGIFKPKQDFTVAAQATKYVNQPLGKTEQKEPKKEVEDMNTQETEGVFLTAFLTPEELHLKESKRNAVLLDKMRDLEAFPGEGAQDGEDGHDPESENYKQNGASACDDLQIACIENLEERFGKGFITTVLLIMQGKDNEDLNKLFSYMF
jgi:hypothetical protein